MASSSSSISYLIRVEEFFKNAGRPFTISDAHSREFHDISKNLLKSAIETLVRKDKIVVKTVGKLDIYFYNYGDSNKEQLETNQELDRRIEKYSTKVQEKLEEIKEIESKLNKTNQKISIFQLETESQTLKERVNDLQKEADKINEKSQSTKINPEELKKMKGKYEKCIKEFNKRKRIAKSMMDQIFENYEKPKKAILEEIEIETDEMVDFNINKYTAV